MYWLKLGLGCLTRFQQYFSYIVVINWWRKPKYTEKTADLLYRVHLAMNGARTHNFSGDITLSEQFQNLTEKR